MVLESGASGTGTVNDPEMRQVAGHWAFQNRSRTLRSAQLNFSPPLGWERLIALLDQMVAEKRQGDFIAMAVVALSG
jgi:hypothetical protein